MIRLLSVQPVAERGGSDQALLRMVRSLPSAEFDCHIALPAPAPLASELRAARATLHEVPMRRVSTSHGPAQWLGYGAGWPVAVWRLVRLVRALDVDVVHTNSLHSWYGWAAAALTRRPHVWHAREITFQSRAALGVERFLTRRFADTVICMSKAIAARLGRANTVVVYEGVDEAEYHPQVAGRFRSRVGIADDVPLVGSVGRIDTWKGIDVLLAAWSRVASDRPDAELLIAGAAVAGKEHYADELAARAARLPRTHWLGARTDVPELLADLDLFVLPSTEPEPYGLVVVEALASGVPVVATDAGGAPEILARAGPAGGRCVPRRDPASLASTVIELVPAATAADIRRARTALQPPGQMERIASVLREAAGPRSR